MPHAPPFISAINYGCFIQSYINGGKRGQKEDSAPAGFFPDYLQNYQGFEEIGIGHYVNTFAAQPSNKIINKAIPAQKLLKDAYYDDPANKVGQVEYTLDKAFNPFAHNAVY